MSYIDGFVCAVPTGSREAYRAHSAGAAELFKRHGALEVVECWGDAVPDGEVTSFPMAVKRRPDETVVFSWIAWDSKEARDAAWQVLSEHPAMNPQSMPFDGKRMIYGGFEPIVGR
jgi:uncharacterized protein YbaA (DUF1428 family)